MATHSSTAAWRLPQTQEPGGLNPWGCQESDTTEQRQQNRIPWQHTSEEAPRDACWGGLSQRGRAWGCWIGSGGR